jgi:hypothetical protein
VFKRSKIGMALWHEYREIERHWRLFGAMITRLDIRPVDLARHDGGRTFRESVDKCVRCQHAAACEAWLGSSDTAKPPPAFCQLSSLIGSCGGPTREPGDPL